jgi:NADPH2:quinone reductase
LFSHLAVEGRLSEMAARLTKVVGSGEVKIAIHARYPLAEAAKAHIALEARATTGATVLLP